MEVTETRVFLRNEERLKAYVTVTFDDCFVVRDLKVIQGNSGLFVSMPSRKKPDGTYRDIAHPLNNETRDKIEKKVLDAYQVELAKPKDQQAESKPRAPRGDRKSGQKSSADSPEKDFMDDIDKSIEEKISS